MSLRAGTPDRSACPRGIFRRTAPLIVGTCASPPSTAVVTGTATCECRSSPFRSNIWCGRMRTRRYRSPAAPPFAPDSPSPAARTREPSLTPTGMRTSTVPRVPALLDRHPAGRAVERFVERQVDLVLDVAPLLNPRRATGPLPSACARSAAAEERLEEIGERILVAEEIPHLLFGHRPVTTGAARVGRVGAAAEGRAPRLPLLLRLLVHAPVGAQLVVLPALLRIAEDLVRLVDLLELRFRRLVARVHVGMVLARQLAVRLLDLLFRRRLGDAERGVVVLEVQCLLETRSAPRRYSPTISPIRSISRASRFRVSWRPGSSRTSGRSRCTDSAIASSR